MDASIVNDIPQDLKSFIVSIVNSYTAWDIVTFFYDAHRPIKADVEEVSSSIGRNVEEVQEVFDRMSAEDVLSITEKDGNKIYVSNPQGKMYNSINQFLTFTSTREGRLKTIYVITSERFKQVD